jgi:hypothetical protein
MITPGLTYVITREGIYTSWIRGVTPDFCVAVALAQLAKSREPDHYHGICVWRCDKGRLIDGGDLVYLIPGLDCRWTQKDVQP